MTMHSNRPEPRVLAEQATAVRRALLPPEGVATWVPRACSEVAASLHHRGIAPHGFPFARYHPRADGRIEVEAGFPVTTPITPSSVVESSVLPGGPVIVAWHVGPDDHEDSALHAIDDWLDTAGAEPTGDRWEIYHDLPVYDRDGRRIEIVQPVAGLPT
jgi:effector-binding domain-containing protein